MNNTVISLDLAKHVIQAAKFTRDAVMQFNKPMSPDAVIQLLANTKPCIVAMEGCGSFHYWGRVAERFGHKVRAMPPIKVKPFIGSQKTDANDAVGIYVACRQPGMTFCQIKPIGQQEIQSIQTSRRMLERTLKSTGNHIGALLYEYGFVFAKGKKALREAVAQYLAPESEALTPAVKAVLTTLWEQYQSTEKHFDIITKQLNQHVMQSEPCQRLMELEGVGEIGAAGLYASLGDGSGFKSGRHASVYVGATPKQHSSGGKVVMLGIDKKGGDKSLRATLFIGALSAVSRLPAEPKTEKQRWLIALVKRVGTKRACIALVNKTVRTAWALLRYNQPYQPASLAA
ncbi:IS110 family transposase [Paraglaciecola sp.]|uniref:IS110 family transposase n=1 Tax=Paraglaciecola sp. TaxID=1920173 RepID=UPI0030F39117